MAAAGRVARLTVRSTHRRQEETMTVPTTGLEALAEQAMRELGAVLVTVTVIVPDGGEVARVHSTHPQTYPVGGRKRLDPSHTSPVWMTCVIRGQQPFFGGDRASVREFFLDWATIEQL